MEPLYLASEAKLYAYLKKFMKENPTSVQLDGSETAQKSGNVLVVFKYSVDQRKYKLTGDLSREAMTQFVSLADEHGSPAVVLRECETSGKEGLTLNTQKPTTGWNCWLYVEKKSQSLRKTA